MKKEQWEKIRTGDILISVAGTPRKCVRGSRNGFVVLKKMRKSKYPSLTTVYCDCDRKMFSLNY